MKKKSVAILIASSLVGAIALAVAVPFAVLGIRTNQLHSDWAYLKLDDEYSVQAEVSGVSLVTQHVSCGYATIEMLSSFYGKKVSEDDLDKKNSSISTSSSQGFLNEVNASIPNHSFGMHSYLSNDVLLTQIHSSLTKNNPVAIEWAAKYEGEWTLHFSVVTALDLKSDNVTVYNPYGYVENIKVGEFLSRTSFEAYSNMPLFLQFGFAYGAFGKNTIFHA